MKVGTHIKQTYFDIIKSNDLMIGLRCILIWMWFLGVFRTTPKATRLKLLIIYVLYSHGKTFKNNQNMQYFKVTKISVAYFTHFPQDSFPHYYKAMCVTQSKEIAKFLEEKNSVLAVIKSITLLKDQVHFKKNNKRSRVQRQTGTLLEKNNT